MLNTIINADVLEGLKQLPDEYVNCIVTSPPYWGLRDYGVKGQIGLEKTPEEYVFKMVKIFQELWRVLRDDGTVWLNLGDTYSSSGVKGTGGKKGIQVFNKGSYFKDIVKNRRNTFGVKPKNLIGIPWRVAFALQADGWYLRQDIIWQKPNPMPESVTDRCTKNHEYIFLLSKSARYYFDAEAIKEDTLTQDNSNRNRDITRLNNTLGRTKMAGLKTNNYEMRNKRSVWTVSASAFKEAHFAIFPENLITPCIKAGCPEGGIVLDPFMGAGTTALVALKHDRNFVGIELNPSYIEIAKKRIEPYLIQGRLNFANQN